MFSAHNIMYMCPGVSELLQLLHTALQYGAWATSKKLPCLHKAYTTPITDHRRIGHANTRWHNIMTGGLLEARENEL